jgi:stage II sporulation protein D
MKRWLLILFVVIAANAKAGLLRIGLFDASSFSSVELTVTEGNYLLTQPGRKGQEIKKGDNLSIRESESVLKVKKNGKSLGTFSKLKLVSPLADGTMRIKLNSPEPNLFTYGGHFEILVSKHKLKIVNIVDLESYVAAVVESETGDNNNIEFLKVQSVLCRTYCLAHPDRHSSDGFQLCDQVHCQTYKGKSRFNKNVEEAVRATKNKVLVDSSSNLIIAAYHSNCGGRTMSADSVWSEHASYLQPVTDTFCLQGKHATWQYAVTLKAWKKYLANNGALIDSTFNDSMLVYNPSGRLSFFYFQDKKIPLKKLREDWNLKSTWFAIRVENDSLFFSGRGFGHGVGLCQEGAMQMAEQGRTFDDIIHFYYKDVKLADADALKELRN